MIWLLVIQSEERVLMQCPYPLSHLPRPLETYFYLSFLSPVISLYNLHVVLDTRVGVREWSRHMDGFTSVLKFAMVASLTSQWFKVLPCGELEWKENVKYTLAWIGDG